jgi:hypothetical protein
VALLIVYLVAFPVGLAIILPLRLRQRLAAEDLLASWRAHVDADQRARRGWIAAAASSRCDWRRRSRAVIAWCCWPRIRHVDPGALTLVPSDVVHMLETAPRGAAARYQAASPSAADAPSPRVVSRDSSHAPEADPLSPRSADDGVNIPADGPPAHHVRVPVVKLAGGRGMRAGALPVYLDRFPKAYPDTLLLPASQGEYRGSQLHFHAEGVAQLLAIAVINISVGEARSVGAAVAQALALMAVLGYVLARTYLWWPHKRGEGWHVYVGFYAQWLALLQALLNCVGVCAALQAGDALQSGFAGLSYFATVAALGLLVLVTVAFAEALWDAQMALDGPTRHRRESV